MVNHIVAATPLSELPKFRLSFTCLNDTSKKTCKKTKNCVEFSYISTIVIFYFLFSILAQQNKLEPKKSGTPI